MQIEAKKPISIFFNKEVHRELKIFAAVHDLSLNDAIKLLLDAYKQQKGEQ